MMAKGEVQNEPKAIFGRIQDSGGPTVHGRGYSVTEVAGRLGITTPSLYAWLKSHGPKDKSGQEFDEAQRELRSLKSELRRVTEERDILRKAAMGSIGQRRTSLSLPAGV